MATTDDIKRLTRRTESLKALELGEAPMLDPEPFRRFPEMVAAVNKFNTASLLRDSRLKNILAEALLGARNNPP